MNKTLKNSLTILISLIIAGGLMYLAISGIDIKKIKNVFIRADYSWILLSSIFGILAYWIRAIRWNLLLEPMGFKISNENALWSLSFGYFMNLGVPRSGEVARATVLQQVEGVPFSNSFGTIVTERIIDMLFMLILLGLTAIFSYPALLGFFDLINSNNIPTQEKNYFWYYFFISIFFLICILLIIFRKKILNLTITQKIIIIGKSFLDGIISIFKLKNSFLFIILSFGIWICYFFASYFVIFALKETSFLTLKDGFFLVTIGTLGMLVPASGGIGAFHTAMKFGFSALFISRGWSQTQGAEIGLSYAFLSHTLQMVIMIVMGIISIPFLTKNKKKFKAIF